MFFPYGIICFTRSFCLASPGLASLVHPLQKFGEGNCFVFPSPLRGEGVERSETGEAKDSTGVTTVTMYLGHLKLRIC